MSLFSISYRYFSCSALFFSFFPYLWFVRLFVNLICSSLLFSRSFVFYNPKSLTLLPWCIVHTSTHTHTMMVIEILLHGTLGGEFDGSFMNISKNRVNIDRENDTCTSHPFTHLQKASNSIIAKYYYEKINWQFVSKKWMSLNFGRAWMPSSSIVVPSFNSSFSIYFDILQKHTSKLSNNKLDVEEAKKKKQQVFLTGIFRYSKTFPYLSDSNYRRCKLFGESMRGSKTCTQAPTLKRKTEKNSKNQTKQWNWTSPEQAHITENDKE